jgi:hypothetical protein
MTGHFVSQEPRNDWSAPTSSVLSGIVQGIGTVNLPDAEISIEPFPSSVQYITGLNFSDVFRQGPFLLAAESAEPARFSEIRREYTFHNEAAVKSYLTDHRSVSELLIKAIPQLKRHFGSDTVFQLRVSAEDGEFSTLYGIVLWPGAVQDIRAAFDRFDDEWWIAHAHQAGGRVTFAYELAEIPLSHNEHATAF